MSYKLVGGDIALLVNDGAEPILHDVQSVLDVFVTVSYKSGYNKIIVLKEDIVEGFFDLKTGIAGELLQKFVNYGYRVAIVGDFSVYTSKALRDFIYESNNAGTINFVESVEKAIELLSQG